MSRTCAFLIAFAVLSSSVQATTISLSLLPAVDGSAEDRDDVTTGALHDGVFESLLPTKEPHLRNFHGFDYEQRSALEFDLSEVPHSARILHATLALHVSGRTVAPLDLTAITYAGDGTIDSEDFTAARLLSSRTIENLPSNLVLAFDVASIVNELLVVDAQFAGFTFRVSRPSDISFASLETDLGEAYRPRLEIEYATVPEPSTLLLALASLTLIVGIRPSR